MEGQDWPDSDLCFLKFRLADLRSNHLEDFEGARQLLREVANDFPESRDFALANSALRRLDEAEFAANQGS